jgi:hypothetical protein
MKWLIRFTLGRATFIQTAKAGQNTHSPQLKQAAGRNDPVSNISGGEPLSDSLPNHAEISNQF